VEILPEYEEGLDGFAGYSHIFILSVFHKTPEYRTLLKVRPRRLLRLGIQEEAFQRWGFSPQTLL